jgi:hypothetical protein
LFIKNSLLKPDVIKWPIFRRFFLGLPLYYVYHSLIMSFFFPEGISASGVRDEESLNATLGNISPLKNVAVATKDGILGTASAPIHMVTAETGQFKEQLWRTFRTIALAFLLISGVGALIEDRGISKGLVLL